jgi:HTH-type transcriptional regulator/antitoxin HigA
MTRTLINRNKPARLALPRSYQKLMVEFAPRLIENDAEYDRAASIVHRLALRESRLDAGERAYLDVLELLIEQYDREQHPIATNGISPTRVLRALVKQAGMSVTELGRLVGSKGAASELLSGKRREPSKAQIRRLCARFKVDASLFLLPAKGCVAFGIPPRFRRRAAIPCD